MRGVGGEAGVVGELGDAPFPEIAVGVAEHVGDARQARVRRVDQGAPGGGLGAALSVGRVSEELPRRPSCRQRHCGVERRVGLRTLQEGGKPGKVLHLIVVDGILLRLRREYGVRVEIRPRQQT